MTGYHEEVTFRERIAHPLYRIPELPVRLERLLNEIIGFIEGDTPSWKHLGKDCPCMTNK